MPMNNDDDDDYEMAVKRVFSWQCMSSCAQWYKCRSQSVSLVTTCPGPDGCDCSQFGLDPWITEKWNQLILQKTNAAFIY